MPNLRSTEFVHHPPFIPIRGLLVLMANIFTLNLKTRQNSYNHLQLSVPVAVKFPTKRPITMTNLALHPPRPPPIHHTTRTVVLQQTTNRHRGLSRTSASKLPAALPPGRSGKQSSWTGQKSVSSSPSIDLRTTSSCALSRVRFAPC